MSHEQDSNETKQKESETQRLQLLVAEPQHDILQEGNFQQKYNDFFVIPAHVRAAEVARTREWGSLKSLNLDEKFKP